MTATAPADPRRDLHAALADDLAREQRKAASGNPGCQAARARMMRLRADMLRLELGRPVH